ncbi:hypothetical protein [Allochromatium palmeri]|uniref:Uncharacterized protein n=1 Tax=Allochromatium palmeri TaxID=231048 RepID=A0A6N8EIE3_9GAMM|nr:hypothetical protein [Allochromatium palmeri]MTW22267.1 hypothetical protein [Allochromatium palmeri]
MQRLKIMDRIGFLHSRQWLESILPEQLSERIRRSSHALAQRQANARQRPQPTPTPDGELIDLVQSACGFRTDTELADFLGVARNTISNVRAGRASLGPRPRLRIWPETTPIRGEFRRPRRACPDLRGRDALHAGLIASNFSQYP